MNILFAVNQAFKIHLIHCLRSIDRFAGSYDVYVLHSDLEDADCADITAAVSDRMAVHFVRITPEIVRGFPESKRYPSEIYYRIFAARLLPDTLDRILYLDADIVVINPLDSLYRMDFDGAYYIACTHTRELLTRLNRKRLGSKQNAVYVNTGVMLINLEYMRREQDLSAVYTFVEQNKTKLLLPDQDIITALYGDKIKLVDSMIYNLSDRALTLYNSNPRNDRRDVDWVRKNAVILHYIGKNKPWKPSYLGVLDVFYQELLQQSGGSSSVPFSGT